MANATSQNVLVVDTTGAITQVTFPIKVLAIDYTASADTWVTLIQQTDGGPTLFRAESDIANQRNFFKYYGGVQVNSMFIKTLTDMAQVLIYFTGPGK